MRQIATAVACSAVCVSMLCTKVSCTETPEPIEMPLEVMTSVRGQVEPSIKWGANWGVTGFVLLVLLGLVFSIESRDWLGRTSPNDLL